MGNIIVQDNRAIIEFERHLKHRRERVWKAITDQEELSRWYLCKVRISGGQGGRIDLWFANTHVYGEIKKWEPPEILEHEWNIDRRDGLPNGERAILRWELSEEGDGTLVRLIHLNLTKTTALGFTEGLEPATSDHILLDRLQAFLNSGSLNIGSEQIYSIREAYRKLGRS
ncbi:MAG TPA: SRPBCC domain-containing protein [Thermoplasmataceae archaeon]|nr:SRPBCC domain-containing protein [Thermoplasmataceae archaeon]